MPGPTFGFRTFLSPPQKPPYCFLALRPPAFDNRWSTFCLCRLTYSRNFTFVWISGSLCGSRHQYFVLFDVCTGLCHILSIHSLVGGHLACFQCGTMTSTVSCTLLVWACVFISLGCAIAGSRGDSVFTTVSQSGFYRVTSPPPVGVRMVVSSRHQLCVLVWLFV